MGNQPTKQINVNQTGKQKKYVHWKSAEVPSAPGKPVLIPVSNQQPDAVTLQWEKPQADGGSPIIGYIIEHRRLGATSWLRSIPILIVNNEASISGLEPGWKYQFRAFAENVVGRSQPSALSDPIPISLQMRNTNTLPKFITELKDTNAIENERLEMRVRVFGNPQPEINWFKDGFEIFSSRRIKIVNENDFSMLIIHQVALTDEGEIKCTATNRAGHVVTKAKLIVEAPPKIRLPRNYEDGLIIEEDDVLKLKAGIAGQPFPAVIWSREGKVISEGSKFEISTTDKHTLLKIDKVKRIDRGEYSIRAINKLGEDIVSFLVTVTAKPRSPGKVKVIKAQGTSVTLSWAEPIDDGGCKIGSYIVEYFRIGWDVWLKATTTRQLQTTLKDLIEGSEYKFRVKAENPYGVSEPSPESDIFNLRGGSGYQQPQTETSISITDNMKNIPSSVRNPLEQSRSPIRASSPSHRTIKPEIFESEQLSMEMSYGANIVDNNVATPKSNKTKEDRGTSPKPILKQRSPIPTPRKNHNNLTLEINSIQIPEQAHRTPSPKIEITSVDFEGKKDPTPPKRSLSPKSKTEQVANEINKKNNLSPVVLRRSISPNKPSDQKQYNPTPTLTEMELRIQERLKMEREKDEIKMKMEREKDETKSKSKSLHPENARNENFSPKKESEVTLNKSFEYLFNKMNHFEGTQKSHEKNRKENIKKPETLQILSENNQNDSTDQQLSSDAEQGRHKDEVHTSNEYMLVFYPDGRAKDMEEPESRNYYAGDNQGPPTLSFSFPNLSTLDEFSFQASIRRSASSTELLYEKAMARFYEAVEMEEERKDKKKGSHLGEHLILQKTTLQNLDSIAESQEISGSFEAHFSNKVNSTKENNDYESPKVTVEEHKNSISTNEALKNAINISDYKNDQTTGSTGFFNPVNRRNVVEMTENQHVVDRGMEEYKADINDMYESDNHEYDDSYKQFSDAEVRENTYKNSLFEDEKNVELEYGSDYTESTASESESSMEYFKREVISRSSSGNIGRKKVTLSPVRYESEDDTLPAARQIKTISSSDSIPKSILKKPSSSESVSTPNSISPTPNLIFNVISNPSPEPNINSNTKSNIQNIIPNENVNLNQDKNSKTNINSTMNSKQSLDYNQKLNSDSDFNTKSNPNPNSKSNTNPYSNSNLNPNTNLNLNSNLNPNSNPNLSSNPNPNSSPNPSSNPNPRSSPNSNPKITLNSNPNRKLNSNSNLNPNTNPNPNEKPKSYLNSNPNEDLYLKPDDERRKSLDEKEIPKLSPLSKAKSISDKKLKGLKSFLTGGRSKSSKDKKQSDNTAQPSTSQSKENKIENVKTPEKPKEERKIVKKPEDEGTQVIVDYYSNIVQELGHSKYKTPLYLDTAELKRQSERAMLEEGDIRRTSLTEIDAEEDLLLLQNKSKPRLSIVERMQTQHVRRDQSSHCVDNKTNLAALPETPPEEVDEPPEFNIPPLVVPSAPPVKKVIKKKIVKRTARSKSRDSSKPRGTTATPSAAAALLIDPNELSRLHALHDQCNEQEIVDDDPDLIKVYTASQQKLERENEREIVKYDPEEVSIEAQDNVHSAINYITDLGLFVFACWVYLFKDAYMVLPILALMVYRRIGEAIKRNIPSFLKKKPPC